MAQSRSPTDISHELAKLKHEKKNQKMAKLPPNATIQRRPLNHAPVASPYAGAHIEKVVYVSRKTPIMSAVKRVKRLLDEADKRTQQGSSSRRHNGKVILNEEPRKSSEEVLVKASGRAMEQALRIGEWFRVREDELLCNVEVRTGNVAAVDDIVEKEIDDADEKNDTEEPPDTERVSTLDGGDTTLELLGTSSRTGPTQPSQPEAKGQESSNKSKRRRSKRKREVYDQDELPEARIRWVKTVEVAISLRD